MISCEELQVLVNNTLSSLQINHTSGVLSLEKIELAAFVQDFVCHTDPRWKLRQVCCIDIAEDIAVIAHQNYLSEILHHLFSNAVKYSPTEASIRITARRVAATAMRQQEICVSIQDSGPGIPASELDLIFAPFARLQRDALGLIRGSGLGVDSAGQV